MCVMYWGFGVGIDYKTKLIDLDNETVKLQIWSVYKDVIFKFSDKVL